MANKKPPEPATQVEPHDPYTIRGLEQMLTLFDGGEFLKTFMADHRDLIHQMQDHIEQHGTKKAKGSFSLSIDYEVSPAGDLVMTAKADFKGPKKPASSAGAYVDEFGEMTLFSPMMKRMHSGVRDVTPHDPETGEVRDA